MAVTQMERAGKVIRGLKIGGQCLPAGDLVRTVWPQAVGVRIASHTRPVALHDGCLVVEVEDAIWRSQLETMSGQILGRLREIAGAASVRALEFRLGVPRRAPQRAVSARAARDEADAIEDPILRRLYKTSRKKATGA
jgi:predicted nucleic acid-binding Zn ribbon protein